MKIRVLGSAAGGGFPQWNCNCRNCAGVRNGTLRAQAAHAVVDCGAARTASDWLLVNASPDILAQIAANPELQPARRARDTRHRRRARRWTRRSITRPVCSCCANATRRCRSRSPTPSARPQHRHPGRVDARALLRRRAPSHRARRTALSRCRRCRACARRAAAVEQAAAVFAESRSTASAATTSR